ncbi:MAG TPA: nucleotidyltransferase family protein [Verrucomicrobiales bacterium]|jgi:molybdenum cofactor cytidylyltransferase|nr:nucleotidyltransferase family protein [Verrucomicrobiales bacterium]
MRRIAGIVLAAGGSTRLGEPKQLLELGNGTLVHAAVRAAVEGGCDTVCVVTGHARAAVENAVAGPGPLFAHNDEWRRGMGSSIRLGLEAVKPADAVVLLACDQPAVDAGVIRSLITLYDQTGRAIAASAYSGTLGIPALFDRSCFDALQSLPDNCGAKAVILAHPEKVAPFEFPRGALDIDSPEDLRVWRTVVPLTSQ